MHGNRDGREVLGGVADDGEEDKTDPLDTDLRMSVRETVDARNEEFGGDGDKDLQNAASSVRASRAGKQDAR